MHIKNIEICGFKSYKDQAGVEEFSPGHNTVVGRNGSGKSNFFRAIQFVLCEKGFTGLSHKERTEMLHEGAGSNVMTAYVQMVFDNSDGRFPMDAEEITLRRTIGLKKDEYFLNNKNFSKSDVINLLESAGFSRSNPYYIVQQGKVNALCLMKDEQRLELLKAVAGTTVYEDRRKASEAIMKESSNKREKIDESVKDLEDRLNKLNEEKEELHEFRTLDKQRRALEYTLYKKELEKASRSLEQLDNVRATEVEKANDASGRIVNAREQRETLKGELKSIQHKVKQADQDKHAVQKERAKLLKQKAKVELKVKDLEEKKRNLEELKTSGAAELSKLETEIAQVESNVESTTLPAYNTAKEAYSSALEKYEHCNTIVEKLQAKQGRSAQFSSQAERDSWLQKEIKSIEHAIQSKRQTLAQLQTSGKNEDELQRKLKEEVKEAQSEMAELTAAIEQCDKQILLLKKERQEKTSQRKEHWRDVEKLTSEIDEKKENITAQTRNLKRSMPYRVSMGLSAVKDISKELGLENKVLGPMFELVEAEEEVYNTALEVAFGPSLQHVIVEDDATAARLIKELHRRRAGRVTFKPLNRLANRNHDTVKEHAELKGNKDCFPLMQKVKCSERIKSVVQSVVGKILLCRNHQVATEWSNKLGVNCVTLEGDQVNRHGALTGGYHDVRQSKLALVSVLKNQQKALGALEDEKDKLKKVEKQAEKELLGLISKVDREGGKRGHLVNTKGLLESDLKQKQKQLSSLEEAVSVQKSALESNQASLRELETKKTQHEEELQSPMLANLSTSEQRELKTSTTALPKLQKEKEKLEQEFETCKVSLNTQRTELKSNLYRRRDELKSLVSASNSQDNSQALDGDDLDNLREELAMLEDVLNGNAAAEAEEELQKLSNRMKDIERQDEALAGEENEQQEVLRSCEQRIEKILTKRAVEKEHIARASREIRELGSLPSTELSSMEKHSITKLLSLLRSVNEKVKKYSHVNKKAMDQFVNFSDKRENLLKRKAELDKGQEQIEKLIKHLDRQKDEAIMRTFRGVAKNFREVFKELVPQGRGELVMVTGNASKKSADSSSSSSDLDQQIEEFIGVSPRVSFTGSGEICRMRQLSGGQRALVALTLIFAIQRCDPAPFYLFDEIDQALDSNHRASVAALIKRQASSKDNPTQFITTTFRSELVEVANKCYGIQFQNKISSMVLLKKKVAMEFIKNIAEEEGGEQDQPQTRKRKSTKPEDPEVSPFSAATDNTSKRSLGHSARKRIQATS